MTLFKQIDAIWDCLSVEQKKKRAALLVSIYDYIEGAEADANRLDFLQDQTKGYGKGWILRESLHGRGMRLHESSMRGTKPTVREAIDAAMKL